MGIENKCKNCGKEILTITQEILHYCKKMSIENIIKRKKNLSSWEKADLIVEIRILIKKVGESDDILNIKALVNELKKLDDV